MVRHLLGLEKLQIPKEEAISPGIPLCLETVSLSEEETNLNPDVDSREDRARSGAVQRLRGQRFRDIEGSEVQHSRTNYFPLFHSQSISSYKCDRNVITGHLG